MSNQESTSISTPPATGGVRRVRKIDKVWNDKSKLSEEAKWATIFAANPTAELIPVKAVPKGTPTVFISRGWTRIEVKGRWMFGDLLDFLAPLLKHYGRVLVIDETLGGVIKIYERRLVLKKLKLDLKSQQSLLRRLEISLRRAGREWKRKRISEWIKMVKSSLRGIEEAIIYLSSRGE